MIKIFTGNISMLGNAIVQNGLKKYLTIEIGDQTIQKAVVTNELDSYLSVALQDSGDVTLYVWEGAIFRVIVGVKLSSGKTYYSEIPKWPQIVGALVLTLFTSGIGGIIGIPMIIHAFMRNGKIKDQFANAGAVEV